MMLACSSSAAAQFDLAAAIVWSIALLAPLVAFLSLPKLLPLRREVVWTGVRLRWALAWLAARVGGDRARFAATSARLRAAWQRDVYDANPTDSRRGEVVRDERLLRRARGLGWIVAGLLVAGTGATLFVVAANGVERYTGRLLLSLAALGLIVAWLGRVAATGAAVLAQSLARGHRLFARLAIGGLVGAGYGAIGGFAALSSGLALLVPLMSLLTWEVPSARDFLLLLTFGGVGAAVVGGLAGGLWLLPLAAATRPRG